jgi:hypothetical protein
MSAVDAALSCSSELADGSDDVVDIVSPRAHTPNGERVRTPHTPQAPLLCDSATTPVRDESPDLPRTRSAPVELS